MTATWRYGAWIKWRYYHDSHYILRRPYHRLRVVGEVDVMEQVPSYTKIFVLGEAHTESVFKGDVSLQEKVDGSQFPFGINERGEMVFRSKNKVMDFEFYDQMFGAAVDHLKTIKDKLEKNVKPDTYFYCEYLRAPKHHTLSYDRHPTNHLMLFDVITGGRWINPDQLDMWAEILDVDAVPRLHYGPADLNTLTELLKQDSYLGGEQIEGVVIKNYYQLQELGSKVIPTFAKYVRPQFKERLSKNPEFKRGKDVITDFVDSFRTEARWHKAVQHLEESGELERHMKDLPRLIAAVHQDVIEEEETAIKDFLYSHFIRRINATAIKGLPEWYKGWLMESLGGEAS
jgi:hypothetical protein